MPILIHYRQSDREDVAAGESWDALLATLDKGFLRARTLGGHDFPVAKDALRSIVVIPLAEWNARAEQQRREREAAEAKKAQDKADRDAKAAEKAAEKEAQRLAEAKRLKNRVKHLFRNHRPSGR